MGGRVSYKKTFYYHLNSPMVVAIGKEVITVDCFSLKPLYDLFPYLSKLFLDLYDSN